MMTKTFSQRLDDIRKIQREYKLFYQLAGGTSLLLIGVWIGSLLFVGDSGYASNAFMEILSVFVTIVLLDRLNYYRQQQHTIEESKGQLIRDVGGKWNEKTKDAVDQLRRRDWLVADRGLLKGEDFRMAMLKEAQLDYANLEGANLLGTNLEGANLHSSRLIGATMIRANLEKANLCRANLADANMNWRRLQRAFLVDARLEGANLKGANLEDAKLNWANLAGANFSNAYLESADFVFAKLDENTILPDGSNYDPNRSDFEQLEVFVKGHWLPIWMKHVIWREKETL